MKQIKVIKTDRGIKLGLLVDLFNMNVLDSPIKTLILALPIKFKERENKGLNKYIANTQLPLLLPLYLYQARCNLWLKRPRSKKLIEY